MASSSTVALPATMEASKISLGGNAIPPSPTQPHTTVITTIPSTPNTVPTGSLLALNDNFIVYAVKNGLIRVMHRSSTLRTLLRGHPSRITDASFFGTHDAGGGSDILASIGGNECRIWRIFSNGSTNDDATEINSEMLLEIRALGLKRVVWHPFNPNQFMLLHDKPTAQPNQKRHVATFVETTRLMTSASAVEENGHAVCDILEKEEQAIASGTAYVHFDGTLNLIVPGTGDSDGSGDCAISDLTFSRDVRYALTAHDDGCVRLWDLSLTVFLDTSGQEVPSSTGVTTTSAKCIMTVPVSQEKEGANTCFFLSAFENVHMGNGDGTNNGNLTNPFVTCTKHGEVSLWSPFTTSGRMPTKVASCQAGTDDGTMWNSSICTLPHKGGNGNGADGGGGDSNNAATDTNNTTPSTFVILSNENGAIHALHLAARWQVAPPPTSGKISTVSGFDYVSFFQSLQSIHSQSVISSPDDSSDVRMWNLDLYCVQSKAVQRLTLSPSMCAAPPVPLAPGIVPHGIVVTPLHDVNVQVGTDTSADIPGNKNAPSTVSLNDEVEHDDEEFIDYDDYEEEEDDGDDEYLDDDEEDEDDEEDDDDEAIDTSNIPPPPMPGFPETNSNNNNNNKSDPSPFANWLGNLAAASSQTKVEATTTAAGAVTQTPVPAAAEIDLADLPLPEEPELVPESIPDPAPVAPEPLPVPVREPAQLLSPMQILGLTPKKTPTKEVVETKPKVEKVKQEKKSSSSHISKSNHNTKLSSSKTSSSYQPVPIPNKGGKIAILKREDAVAKKSTIIPIADAKSSLTSAPGNGSGNNNSNGITKDDVEDIVRRAVSSHFHKQEQFITAEIQKAVRYEVQSGVVPALNKTVAQTLEQTVTKTMKTNVTKTIKECMESNTTDMVKSISSNLEEPLVDGFHQSMREIMIPAYESGTRQMFEQISSSIETGLELKEKDNAETAKLMDGMVKRMDAMGKTIEVLIKAVAQLQGNNSPSATAQRSGGGDTSRNTKVNEEELLRAKIIGLIQAKEYEKAFTTALTVSNSAMALFAVKHSALSVVIEGDTPALSQPIMLCLMQQLGADLSTDEDLSVKLAWLQSIAVTLDPYSENIKKHIQGVVQQLVNNLQAKMQESDPTLRRHLQMLLQVIRGIGNA